MDTMQRLTGLREKVAEADRSRAQAEAALAAAKQRLAEINQQIKALGVDPEKAEDELVAMEAQMEKDLAGIEEALREEQAAYRSILEATQ